MDFERSCWTWLVAAMVLFLGRHWY